MDCCKPAMENALKGIAAPTLIQALTRGEIPCVRAPMLFPVKIHGCGADVDRFRQAYFECGGDGLRNNAWRFWIEISGFVHEMLSDLFYFHNHFLNAPDIQEFPATPTILVPFDTCNLNTAVSPAAISVDIAPENV